MTAEVPLVFQLHAGAVGLGALTACWGAGMAGGSWYAARMLNEDNETMGVLMGRLAMAAGVGLVAFAHALDPALGCYLLGGVGGGFMGVASQSIVLRRAGVRPVFARGAIVYSPAAPSADRIRGPSGVEASVSLLERRRKTK